MIRFFTQVSRRRARPKVGGRARVTHRRRQARVRRAAASSNNSQVYCKAGVGGCRIARLSAAARSAAVALLDGPTAASRRGTELQFFSRFLMLDTAGGALGDVGSRAISLFDKARRPGSRGCPFSPLGEGRGCARRPGLRRAGAGKEAAEALGDHDAPARGLDDAGGEVFRLPCPSTGGRRPRRGSPPPDRRRRPDTVRIRMRAARSASRAGARSLVPPMPRMLSRAG